PVSVGSTSSPGSPVGSESPVSAVSASILGSVHAKSRRIVSMGGSLLGPLLSVWRKLADGALQGAHDGGDAHSALVSEGAPGAGVHHPVGHQGPIGGGQGGEP